MKDKIVLHGSYFGDNFGDRLFIEMFVDWLIQIEGIEREDIVLPFANPRIREATQCSELRGLKAIFKGKCFVYTGGGYFGEFNKSLTWNARLVVRHLLMALYAIFTFKPLIIIGVGAGPLSNPITKKIVTFVCNHSKKVIVRDVESYVFLLKSGVSNNKVKQSVDSVLGLETAEKKEKRHDEKVRIGLHVFYPFENEDVVNILNDIKLFTDTIDDYEIIYFMDLHKEGFNDYALKKAEEMLDTSKMKKVKYENPKKLIDLIGSFDILFTIKLHVGIVALTQGVKTFSIAVHQKTPRLYKQLNLQEYSTNMNNYKKGSILKMTENWEEVKQMIPCEVIAMAKDNQKELEAFIEEYYSKRDHI